MSSQEFEGMPRAQVLSFNAGRSTPINTHVAPAGAGHRRKTAISHTWRRGDPLRCGRCHGGCNATVADDGLSESCLRVVDGVVAVKEAELFCLDVRGDDLSARGVGRRSGTSA